MKNKNRMLLWKQLRRVLAATLIAGPLHMIAAAEPDQAPPTRTIQQLLDEDFEIIHIEGNHIYFHKWDQLYRCSVDIDVTSVCFRLT